MINTPYRRTIDQRIVTVLLRTTCTLTTEEIAHQAQCSGVAVYGAMRRLKAEYGDRIIVEYGKKRGNPTVKYRMTKKKVTHKQGVNAISPADLWRGWINPLTGIVPEKLGL